MRLLAFTRRTAKEILRDPLTIIFGLVFPLVLLLFMSLIQSKIPVPLFTPERLTPGIAVFGLSFMTLFSSMLISKDRVTLSGADKISICFEAPDACGSLYHLMSHLTYNNLNMNRIESIVISRDPLDYRFFMDLSGNLNDSAIKNAVLGLRDEARNFKILGNYR